MEYKYAKRCEKRKPRPHQWLSGPDEFTHEKFYAWHKHRAQANFRDEEYYLTFEDWQQLWPDDKFQNRGRDKDSFVLTRIDRDGPWSIANCHVMLRHEVLIKNIKDRICGRGSSLNPNRQNKSKKKKI